ncbi:hypothetical protein MARSALSMR5_02769 [Marinobacter salarius]|uniref:Uncharacterized protein n=1 Tax=Marinobacter salarius TaxID=1420917 RepID=A0A1W6KBK7_9GAMM|nr:hypothetical protein MARSALSMR5_02769 [Marinobacter salarius]
MSGGQKRSAFRKALDLKVYFKVIVSSVLPRLRLRCVDENVQYR